MKRVISFGVCVLASMLLTACGGGRFGSDVYSREEVRNVYTSRDAVVLDVRPVRIDGKSGVVGTYGGAYVGNTVGGNIGDGRGDDIARAVGTVAGAAAGRRIERAATGEDGLEITLRMDDGKQITIVQGAEPGFVAGESVRVLLSGNGRGRVVKP